MNVNFLCRVIEKLLSGYFISSASIISWNNFIKAVFWQVDEKIS
jgi:hypothetical protein